VKTRDADLTDAEETAEAALRARLVSKDLARQFLHLADVLRTPIAIQTNTAPSRIASAKECVRKNLNSAQWITPLSVDVMEKLMAMLVVLLLLA
jgi:hypothetical protein